MSTNSLADSGDQAAKGNDSLKDLGQMDEQGKFSHLISFSKFPLNFN